MGDTSAVIENLKLPTVGQYGSTITWVSSDETVISNTGVIYSGDEDKTATLTATLTRGGISKTKTFEVTVKNKEAVAYAILNEAADKLNIPNADDIRGNITLPSTGEKGTTIKWETDRPDVVNVNEIVNEGYDNTPPGIVTRQDTDVRVKLTATITYGEKSITKEIPITVKAKPKELNEDDFKGYLMAHFTGESATGEQIYFATSRDGLHWQDLNDSEPVLVSDVGEKGVRDPSIIRSAEGDKFYMLATDLRIASGKGWDVAQFSGSTSLVVWESTDLVNWSAPRLINVAGSIYRAGCAWAPEAIYDERTGEYIVYWATIATTERGEKIPPKIYYSKTRDFYNFTPAQVYIDRQNSIGLIDTQIIKVDNSIGGYKYYRASGDGQITFEGSNEIFGTWDVLGDLRPVGLTGNDVEGPIIFKFNGRDEWCIMVDQYASGRGYLPIVTKDLSDPNSFRRLDSSEYSLGANRKRHGSVLNITEEEYNALMAKWGDLVTPPDEEEQEEPVLEYNFDEVRTGNEVQDASGNNRTGTLYGNATYVMDAEKGSQVLYLDGTSNTYAAFPQGFFDGRDTFSISMDVKPVTVSGFFFTFTIGKNDTKYMFLRTRDTEIRNAITVASYPNEQEVLANTSSIANKWINIKLIITPTSMSLYKDGILLAENKNVTISVTDLGKNLLAYLGKSFYSGDQYFRGYFDNVKVYNRVLAEEEIAKEAGDEAKQILLQKAKNELTLGDTSAVTGNLTLPTIGPYGTTISWASSDESAISNTGVVTLKDEEQVVKLTATIEFYGVKTTKEFTVTLVSQNDIAKTIINKIYIPYVLTEGDVLPTSVDGVSISWGSSDTSVIGNDGSIKPPSEGMVSVTLTAAVSYNGQQASKYFNVKVMESSPSYILSYIRTGSSFVTDSMHLGYSADGNNFVALHDNTGILYPKADFVTNSVVGITKKLRNPYIFRMEDGNFGIIATRISEDNTQDARERSSVLLFTSKDLISYEEVGLVSLNTTETVNNPRCEFDPSTQEYRIEWKAGDGTVYYNTTADFQAVSEPKVGSKIPVKEVTASIAGAVPGNVIAVTKAEAKAITNKFMKIVNTEVSNVEISITKGQSFTFDDLSKMKVTAYYSDGSTAEKVVNWNKDEFDAIDFSKPGVYQVTGRVKQTEYPRNMIPQYADPNVLLYKGKYYFIATNENGQRQLDIREADTILGLKDAPTHTIWVANSSGDMAGCIWAPELHEINGNLYIFFAAATASTWNTVQSRVMKLKEGGNPLNASDWEAPVRVLNKNGGYLYTQGITLDMTYFEHENEHYVIWAQREITSPKNGSSDLYIAKINPEEPWKLITDPVRICRPDYGWERQSTEVVEGPFVLKHGDKIFVTYSGSSVSPTYRVGLLTADKDSDLLDPASWIKTNYPILASESVPGENGPGHNSFTVDEDGNVVLIYHTYPSSGSMRNANARRVHWASDGTPVLDMTLDREILPENRTVTATVTVKPIETDEDYTIETSFNMTGLEADKLLNANVNVTNNKGIHDSVLAIVALYDRSNRMVNMSYISKTIAVGETDSLSSGFRLPSDVTGYSVKVFVWEGDTLSNTTMQPLSNVVVLQ
ncbi:MAG: family 43 glycosylhydrolase [Clostridiaceae bacterium]|nr:family 43 glycosylhydrolase [Clostridiaceae bacterium]